MKKIIFVLVVIFSYTLVEANNCEIKKEKIHLKGALTKPTVARSITINEPVVVIDNDNSLHIGFNQNLGRLDITIVNEQGTVVYQQSVNALLNGFLNISTNNFNNGIYTITISGSEGSLTGEFNR